MTREEFLSLLQQPETIQTTHIADLNGIVAAFPYFVAARLLLTQAMRKTASVHFLHTAQQTALYVPDRRALYQRLYPENLQTIAADPKTKTAKTLSGDYFEMMETIEKQGVDTKKSLAEMAARLKVARQNATVMGSYEELRGVTGSYEELQGVTEVVPIIVETEISLEERENLAKKMIAEKKYTQAIAILRELNLLIPKKSIYFAAQIQFLEKIIDNSKI